MKKNKYFNVLQKQYLTEKSNLLADKLRKTTFCVDKLANKKQIKYSIEKLFNVRVMSVNIINVKGKFVKFKSFIGKRSNWKKAIVSLKDGNNFDFSKNLK